MAWPSTGNYTAWTNRKKVTLNAADMVGTGTHNLIAYLDLSSDSDIMAGCHPTGKDIRIAASDGETALNFELVPRDQWVTRRNAAAIWFGNNHGYYNAAHDKTYYCVVLNNRQYVYAHDHSAGTWQRFLLTSSGDEEKDDHNQASVIVLSTGALLAVYSTHSASNNIFYRVTSSTTGDISTFGSESNFNPSGLGTPKYSYMNLFHLPDRTGGGRIVLVYRTDVNEWGMVDTAEGSVSWSSETQIWNTGSLSPYIKAVGDGSTRIDFLATQGHPETVTPGNEVYHFYYDDGTFYNSAGTSRSTPLGDSGDTNPATLIVDPGTDNAWIEDIQLNGSGNPVCLVSYFPSNVASNQDLYVYTWSGSAWDSGTKIADTGTGPETSGNDPNYTGGACFLPGTVSEIYCGIEVSGTYEIQHWEDDSGWSKKHDITTGSTADQFRPLRVEGSATTRKGHMMFHSGSYPSFNGFETGLRAYPALDHYAADAYVRMDSLDFGANTDIYVYYNNDAAADGQNRAATYANYYCVARQAEPLSEAVAYSAPDPLGNGTVTYQGEFNEENSSHSQTGDVWKLTDSNDEIEIAGLDWQDETDMTFQIYWRSDIDTNANERTILSNWITSTNANILLRVEPAGGNSYELFWVKASGQDNGVPSGLVPSSDTWYWTTAVFDSNNGVIMRQDQSEAVIDAGSTDAFDTDASSAPFRIGQMPSGADELFGYANELRISKTALHKDVTDTEYAAWNGGIVTFGTEEDAGSAPTTTVPVFIHHYNQMRAA